MLGEMIIRKCLSALIIIQLMQTSSASHKLKCKPSACGRIANIRGPFRLKGDPENCGHSELVCENNTAFLYLNSNKYHVQAISYDNQTIHLVDAALKSNTCSFPQHSLYRYNVPHPYYTHGLTKPVYFISCPYPLNSSLYLETSNYCGGGVYASDGPYSSTRRYTYVKVGTLRVSDIKDMCSIDVIAMTSWTFEDVNNISLSEIHGSLLYGFELSYHSLRCDWAFSGVFWLIMGIAEFILPPNLVLRFIIGVPFMFGLLIYKFKRRHLSVFQAIERFLQSQNNLMPIRYSYSDIKKMTKGFREKLGEGGYGSVYKGKLRSGRDVAVKILGKTKGNGQDFINEVATIGRIHHVNVVRLVGYCVGMSKTALVYEFMPNGSLEKYISRQQGTSDSLNWEKKHAIAFGVARGIEYLHRGCDVRILHFDIKPHNILLDSNFTPKVSDFGLAKSYPAGNSIVNLTAARGTIGFVAPELINRSIGEVSYKVDVYSFGMLLMEMVGLNRNLVENTEHSSQYFPDWIYDRFNRGKDIEIGDAGEGSYEERELTRKMTIVALWCIQMNPVHRPSMGKVLEMLESEVGNLQIPPQHFQLPLHVASPDQDQTWETESTDSKALLCSASGSLRIAVE